MRHDPRSDFVGGGSDGGRSRWVVLMLAAGQEPEGNYSRHVGRGDCWLGHAAALEVRAGNAIQMGFCIFG